MIEESHRGADRSPCVRSHQDSAADEVLSRRRPPARARRWLWRFMASSPKVMPQKDKVPENGGSETPPDSPLLGLSDAAVKKLIRTAKKRGYVTHDQINSVLPSEEVNSKQIEDVLAMFGGADELYGRIGEAGQRAIRDGLAILPSPAPLPWPAGGASRSCLPCLSPRPALSPRRVVVRSRSR